MHRIRPPDVLTRGAGDRIWVVDVPLDADAHEYLGLSVRAGFDQEAFLLA